MDQVNGAAVGPDEAGVKAGRSGSDESKERRLERERLKVETLNRVCLLLEENPDREVSLEQLGAEVGWSPSHLQRVFRDRLGVSPKEYSQALRVSRMKEDLRAGRESGRGATRAIFEAGFGSVSSGYEAGIRHLGMTPATYGAGGLGARIEYCAVACSLGWLMVGRTERGICSLTLGDDVVALERDLRSEFPEAELVSGDDSMSALCERLVAVADRGEDGRDLPVEVVATDFQWRVWRAMRQIPPGETRSYSELAEMAGHPKATRAVGTACARNPVSLLIPCHRVVRADGSIGNYAWGVERKARLLSAEAG
jgi:AraC family transcriptional regulator of adaptative response/methylated-DNA-[protein]-cysteine methyltransferase